MMEEAVNMEAFYVCDFCRKFVSLGQPCRGVHQDSQICNKNHICDKFRVERDFFCDGFREFFGFATHKISVGIAPIFLDSFNLLLLFKAEKAYSFLLL